MAYEYGITAQPHPIADNEAFDRVVLTPHMRGGTIVTFWIRSSFNADGPWAFYLEWAEHPSGDWIDVAGPVVDNVLVDTEQRRFSALPHSVYRVRAETGGGIFYSYVNPVMGEWNYHQWRTAREIIRREYLRMQKYTGTEGFYLARKQWGELCPSCLDHNTDMVTDSHCSVCYGTRFVGGYYAPTTLWVEEDRVAVRTQREPERAVTMDQSQIARVVAYPFLTSEDVWVSKTTGERWIIKRKQEAAALQGKPLIYSVELRLAQPANIVYDVPLEAAASSSSQ